MHIRKPSRSDYKEIAGLINEAAEIYRTIHIDKIFDEVGYGTENVDSLIKGEKNREYLCVYDKEEIIGYASFRLKNSQTFWISMFYVKKKRQKSGIGTFLMKELEKIAKKHQALVIVLETDKKATWAIEFYKKMGFKILFDENLSEFPFDKVINKPQVVFKYIFGKKIR